MAFPLSLEQDQYEALISLARRGATTPDAARDLETFLLSLEKAGGITRYTLWVQWQEMNQPLPPGTNFPKVWPPQLRSYIQLTTRPIAKTDVEAVLLAKAKQPFNTYVTKDPAAEIGWTKLDDFFIT